MYLCGTVDSKATCGDDLVAAWKFNWRGSVMGLSVGVMAAAEKSIRYKLALLQLERIIKCTVTVGLALTKFAGIDKCKLPTYYCCHRTLQVI